MDLRGHFLDGKTAQKREATVRVENDGLRIQLAEDVQVWWPYAAVRQNRHYLDASQIRLEKDGPFPEILIVPKAPFFRTLRQTLPQIPTPFYEPGTISLRLTFPFLAGLGAIGIVLSLYLWGVPFLATWAASRVPVSWEENLGRSIVDSLAPPQVRCDDPAHEPILRQVMGILTASLPERPYTFRIIVVDDPEVNAFAAPGGTIVLYRGLLERIKNTEELAGVLAHEMQHILHRHSTRILLGNISLSLLFSVVMGEANSAMRIGREGASILGTLNYSRQYEEQADEEGIRLILAAGIDPKGMISFFEKIQKEDQRAVPIPAYFSTHPNLNSRIARLKAIAQEAPLVSPRMLPRFELPDAEEICQ